MENNITIDTKHLNQKQMKAPAVGVAGGVVLFSRATPVPDLASWLALPPSRSRYLSRGRLQEKHDINRPVRKEAYELFITQFHKIQGCRRLLTHHIKTYLALPEPENSLRDGRTVPDSLCSNSL